MTDHAIVTGTYSDLKFIKGRSVVQIVVEAPIEAGEHIVAAFGTPQPGNEIPVAIARLEGREEVPYGSISAKKDDSEPSNEPERKPTSRAQMSGICCGDPAFWAFLNERYGPYSDGPVENNKQAAEVVRGMCMIESRQLLDVDHEAGQLWDQLLSSYRAWQRAPQCGVGQ